MIITRDENHRYLVDGRAWPSVTGVIGSTLNRPELNRWREQQGTTLADSIGKAAAAHGTLVHGLASLHAEKEAYIPFGDGMDEIAGLQLEAFRTWYDANVVELYGTEIFVAHPRYHYAGQLDFMVRLTGDVDPTLVDIKSGKSVHKDSRAQSAAYRDAALATVLKDLGFTRCRRGVLWIPSGENAGKIRFIPHDHHKADLQAFLSLLFVFNWMKT